MTPREEAFGAPLLTDGKGRFLAYLTDHRTGVYGELREATGKSVRYEWFDPLTGITHPGGEQKLGNNGWLGMKRPRDYPSPMAIAVFEVLDE